MRSIRATDQIVFNLEACYISENHPNKIRGNTKSRTSKMDLVRTIIYAV